VVEVIDRDLVMPRLDVVPSTALVDPPNPFTQAHGVGAEFTTESGQSLQVSVLTLGMQTVWSYLDAPPLGFQHVHWGSRDHEGQLVPPGTYWMRAWFDGAEHINVLFMQP
jgi:hypothetical protein